MSNRFNPAEMALRDAAEKVIKDAKYARTDVDPGCLGRLRGMEKRFSFALDLDQTAPTQIGIMKQFGDQALKMDILYDKMIRHNQETMDIAKKNIDINFKLMVLHSIVALGKLCEAVLAVFPATSKAGEVLSALKTTISSGKDFIEANKMPTGGSEKGKTLEGLLKQFGDQGKALADLIGGIVDVEGGEDKSTTVKTAKLAGSAANIGKLIKGAADTLSQLIKFLKNETSFSKQLGNAAVVLDVLVNLAECYANAMKAYEDYDNQMRLARTIGHQKYHARNLRGSGNSASHASRKAFEHAVSKTTAGKAKVKIDLVDFSRAINSETEARNWGMQMRAKTAQLNTDLKAAEKTLKEYADQYSVEMAKLATKYKLMLPHQAKLLKSWKAIVDYESENYSGGRRSDILSHSHGYLRSELKYYDEALAKAQVRLDIPAQMSESRLRSQ